MDLAKHTIDDGVRMVGQLLLHHPTTRFFARRPDGTSCFSFDSEAYCFCFVGAVTAVSNKLGLNEALLLEMCQESSNCTGPRMWDDASDVDRELFALRMAEY